MSRIALLMALVAPASAFACPGKGAGTLTSTEAAADPAACAKKAELVGDACSYTTGMMAQRVLTEGKPWTYTGRMARFEGKLSSHVAAAYTVGPDAVYVVANEVVESLSSQADGRVALEGRVLDVDGTRYFVVTSFAAGNT